MKSIAEQFIELEGAACQVAELLQTKQTRVVFAESCTAGMVAATVARIPGVSQWLCGSAVTYQESVKTAWLDVEPAILKTETAVSDLVTRQMAISVLQKTESANLSAAITGHLGPGSPASLDGVCFIAIAARHQSVIELKSCLPLQLKEPERVARQLAATRFVLESVANYLNTQRKS